MEGNGHTDRNIEWDHSEDEGLEFIDFMFGYFYHLPSEDIVLGDRPISIAKSRVEDIEHDDIHLNVLNFSVIGWEIEDDASFCELGVQ